MRRVLIIATLVVAGTAASAASAQRPRVQSPDGLAVLTLGGSLSAAAPVTIVKLPDSGDPAEVVGTHYRVEPDGVAMPPSTRLAIRWEAGGLPGGASAGTLVIGRRDAGEWVTTRSSANDGAITAPVDRGGEFDVRWHASTRCAGAAYHTLDFRLGVWDYRAQGYDPGRTTVTADPSGCGLVERYVDVKGGRSSSLFLMDADRRWHVTTYDPGGRSVMAGVVEPGAGVVFYHSPVDREAYRPGPNGTATFSGERSVDNGQTWRAWVTAVYTRVTGR